MAGPSGRRTPDPKRRGPGDPARRPGQPGNQRETDPLRKPEPFTSDQLRDAIDHGETADKVNFPDPAAAPLGTDDEAAGAPPSQGRIAAAMASESSSTGAGIRDRSVETRDRARAAEGAMRLEVWILIAVVMLAMLAVIVWLGMPGAGN